MSKGALLHTVMAVGILEHAEPVPSTMHYFSFPVYNPNATGSEVAGSLMYKLGTASFSRESGLQHIKEFVSADCWCVYSVTDRQSKVIFDSIEYEQNFRREHGRNSTRDERHNDSTYEVSEHGSRNDVMARPEHYLEDVDYLEVVLGGFPFLRCVFKEVETENERQILMTMYSASSTDELIDFVN